MKSNEEVVSLIRGQQWDSVRYATLTRIRHNQLDLQAWIYLGQAFIGLRRGRMARMCLHRAQILDPFIKGLEQAFAQTQQIPDGNDDEPILQLLEHQQVTVTACILTRNSERTIARCIDALQDAVDEIVVVDTGSTDNTPDIAEKHGATVHHYAWQDDFAVARNYAQAVAKSDWVIMVDSDEILLNPYKPFIRETASVYNQSQYVPSVRTTIRNIQQGQILPTRMLRMYPTDRGLRWEGRIHERLVSDAPMVVGTGLIEFDHDGYDATKVDLEDKWRRNIHLLKLAIEENPDMVSHHYYLGREQMFLGELNAAEASFKRAIELMHAQDIQDDFAGRIYSDFANFLLFKRQNEEEAKSVALQLTKLLPDHPDGWGWMALIQMSPECGKEYVSRLQNAVGKYRGNFDLEYNLKVKMPQVF